MQDSKLQKWALAAEIVGAISVVITLIFLTLQISDGAKATRAQTAQALFEQLQESNRFIMENEYRFALRELQNNGYANLDPEEATGATLLFNQLMLAYDNAYYQYNQGTLDEYIFERFRNSVKRRASRPFFSEYWKREHGGFTQPFQEWVETLIKE